MTWTLPIKTDHMAEQAKHKPSLQYAQDIHRVALWLNNFTALEIGGAWGLSTLAILEAGAKHLTTVDPNLNIKAKIESEANGYENHTWTVCRSDKFWAENLEVEYDLIYIDGSHIYKDVKNDLYEGWKRLSGGGGSYLLVDDWDHSKNILSDKEESEYGVSLACFEFWRDHKVMDIGLEGRVLWFEK